MARIRTIKPEFFTSEDIVALPVLARLLYVGLWCEADKEGRLKWKPPTFKMRYLPSDKCDIDAICSTLVDRGLVILYGDGLAFIPSFKEHQHINPREKESAFPGPSDEELTRGARVSDASVTGREEGREGRSIGREGNLSSSDNPQADTEPEANHAKPRKQHGTKHDYEAAQWIFECVLVVNATAKQPSMDAWANDIRLMREQDNRTHEQICDLFGWANKDNFWKTNILSPATLRKQWDQLQAKRGNPVASAKPDNWTLKGVDHSSTEAAMQQTMLRLNLESTDEEVKF